MSKRISYKLFGLGGAGGKICDAISVETQGLLPSVVFDTDYEAISRLGASQQIRLGELRFGGRGSGGDLNMVKMVAQEEQDLLRAQLEDVKIALVVVGFGGGTGAGLLPHFLRLAAEHNIRTIVFEIIPFRLEDQDRLRLAGKSEQACDGLGDLRIRLANDELISFTESLTLEEAFSQATQTASRIITLFWKMGKNPGYLHIDQATLMRYATIGRGLVDVAFAESSAPEEQRLYEVSNALANGEVFGLTRNSSTARAALVGVLGGRDLRMSEIGDIAQVIKENLPHGTDFRLSTIVDDSLNGSFSVVVLLFRSWQAGEEEAQLFNGAADSSLAVTTAGSLSASGATAASGDGAARFAGVGASFYEGVNLDEPTYLRRRLILDLS